MKEFVSHIDYLIQKHDCVIIPDFGGFVLSHEDASFKSNGSILPPRITIGFNPELKYNDGLLAESYMNMYAISYDEACDRIEESVKRLKTILNLKHPLQIGSLGKLSLDKNNNLVFAPNPNLSISHPETFGLSAVNMKKLSVLEEELVHSKRRRMLSRLLIGGGSVAAAITLFFVASTPINDDVTQKSSFFTDLLTMPSNTSNEEIVEPNIASVDVPEEQDEANTTWVTNVHDSEAEVEQEIAEQEEAIVSAQPTKEAEIEKIPMPTVEKAVENKVTRNQFYIVVGSATNTRQANTLLAQFQKKGFDQAQLIKSSARTRIYVASFNTKDAAESYLVTFRQNHPDLHDAWVLHQE